MSRLPIRVQMTAAFAVAMVALLVASGSFVYVRLRGDLDESVNAALVTRADAVLAARSTAAAASGEREEGFAQLLTVDGRALAGVGGVTESAASRAELRRAASGEAVTAERRVPGIDGTVRMLVKTDGATAAVVGQSLDDRDETLGNLIASFALGGPIAVVLASLLGYTLAAAGLRPVEAMRRRAQDVSLTGGHEPLPLPAARDEIRRLGETLNEMLDRLSGSFERERRFVADASHELRTPAAVIRTELEGALRAGGHAPEVREALVASIEECDHLGQLADDLLVVARTGDGELPVWRTRVDVGELLERVRRRFGARAAERDRPITVDAGDAPPVHADALRLEQALGNLVDNALRYGHGAIVLRARHGASALELTVTDEGSGFPRELAARAFDRFVRGDLARTRDGTGLGLSIVRTIAEAHGGTAVVVPGPGATVCIRLPDRPSGPSKPVGLASRIEGITPTQGGRAT